MRAERITHGLVNGIDFVVIAMGLRAMGIADDIIQRTIEVISSFPTIPLWAALAAALPPVSENFTALDRYFLITVVLSFVSWTGLARQLRAKVMAYRSADFCQAALAAGGTDARIIFVHMLPNAASHIIVTFAMAFFVFVMVTFIAIAKHGMKFFSFFLPHGVPIAMAPLLIPIEIISYLSRPVSLSVRLFANMLAGHITLKVFGGFVTMLGAAGFLGWLGAALPFVLIVALTALELLVAFLQAYVFAILTCIYLNDAIHPGH